MKRKTFTIPIQVELNTPQSLDELVPAIDKIGVKIPILTKAWGVSLSEIGAIAHSTLKGRVIPHLVADAGISITKQNIYRRLGNETQFASGNVIQVVKNLSSFGIIWSSKGTKVVLGKEGLFAVVDNAVALNLFRQNLALFLKYKPATGHNLMSFYTQRNLWLVQNNFLENNFVSGLTTLVEGGLFQRWDINYRIVRLRLRGLVAFREMRKCGSQSIETGLNKRNAEATTLEQVTVPLDLYLGMVLASVCVFLKEFRL